MNRISDALELLTAQHEEIDKLLGVVIGTDDAAERDRALANLVDRIRTHLAIEQEVFYPAVAAALSPDVMREVLSEHLEIRRVLGDVLWLGLEDRRGGELLDELRTLLAGHSRWQEEQLFTALAESTSGGELSRLGEHIHRWCARDLASAA